MKKYIIELPESTMSLARNDGFMSRNGDLITAQFDINNLTPVEDNKPISYIDCANAMLKMWMLNVVTDGEYYRIMDMLNKTHENGFE